MNNDNADLIIQLVRENQELKAVVHSLEREAFNLICSQQDLEKELEALRGKK